MQNETRLSALGLSDGQVVSVVVTDRSTATEGGVTGRFSHSAVGNRELRDVFDR